jgi:hypothetical protein
VIEIESDSDPYSMFLFAMRSPKTREKSISLVDDLSMMHHLVGIKSNVLL